MSDNRTGGESDVELVMSVMRRATAASQERGFALREPEHRTAIAQLLVRLIVAGERNDETLLDRAMTEIQKRRRL